VHPLPSLIGHILIPLSRVSDWYVTIAVYHALLRSTCANVLNVCGCGFDDQLLSAYFGLFYPWRSIVMLLITYVATKETRSEHKGRVKEEIEAFSPHL